MFRPTSGGAAVLLRRDALMVRNLASHPHDSPGHFAGNVPQSAFDFASVGLAICGRDGRMLFVNDCLCAILGYGRDELTDQPWTNYLCPAAGDARRHGPPDLDRLEDRQRRRMRGDSVSGPAASRHFDRFAQSLSAGTSIATDPLGRCGPGPNGGRPFTWTRPFRQCQRFDGAASRRQRATICRKIAETDSGRLRPHRPHRRRSIRRDSTWPGCRERRRASLCHRRLPVSKLRNRQSSSTCIGADRRRHVSGKRR